MVTRAPKTFSELQCFYTDVYTPLYDRFINSGAAPQELHAESAACLDHLFCHANGDVGQLAEEDVRRAAGHLKRATFDGFKLIFVDGSNCRACSRKDAAAEDDFGCDMDIGNFVERSVWCCD